MKAGDKGELTYVTPERVEPLQRNGCNLQVDDVGLAAIRSWRTGCAQQWIKIIAPEVAIVTGNQVSDWVVNRRLAQGRGGKHRRGDGACTCEPCCPSEAAPHALVPILMPAG